jgi:hypothetical protein
MRPHINRPYVELVLAPALRFGEEPFLEYLEAVGARPAGRRRGAAPQRSPFARAS